MNKHNQYQLPENKKTEKNEKGIKKETTKPPDLTNNKLYDKYKLQES